MTPEAEPGPSLTKPRGLDVALLGLAVAIPVLPNVIYACMLTPRSFWYGQIITGALVVACPFLLTAKPRLSLAILFPFAALTPMAIAYALATGYAPTVLTIEILRESTREEIMSFAPALIGSVLGALAIAALYGWTARRWRGRRFPLGKSVRLVGLLLLVLVLGKDFAKSGFHSALGVTQTRLEAVSPIAPYMLLARIKFSRELVPDRKYMLTSYAVSQTPVRPGPEVVVLVIGESARKRAFGLFNPGVGTTPLLEKRNDLYVFRDATSCGTATMQAVPILLTGRFPEGEWLPFHRLGLVEAYRIAGFQTTWISTQGADGEIMSFISDFSANAQKHIYLNGRVETSKFIDPKVETDAALLAPFDEALRTNTGKLFLVLHTLGGHLVYCRRYPPEFEKWPVDAKAKEAMWRWVPALRRYQREQLDHAYLNTVLFTDWFLNQVIDRLQKAGGTSSMLYLGDHGENTAEAPLMPAAHGISTTDVVHIPMLGWLSPEFKAKHPEMAEALSANAKKPVSALDVFSTLCTLGGLQTSEASAADSLATSAYRERERKVLLLDLHVVPAP